MALITSTTEQLEFDFEASQPEPDVEPIRTIYEEVFAFYDPDRTPPPIDISFYPYTGINHTIRIRDAKVFVRIGDICDDMPMDAHRGLAFILVGKLRGRKIPAKEKGVYSTYTQTLEMREKATANKRARGRKVVTTTKGTYCDLDTLFNELNVLYFRGTLPKPTLTWSARKTYHILGHHDAAHDHVTISRSLDSRIVPRFIVEYVLFHEMLHIAHPIKHINGRRHSHTPEFKRDEKKFARYHEAEEWIENNVYRLKRASRRR